MKFLALKKRRPTVVKLFERRPTVVKLFGYIHGTNSSVERELWLVFEGNVIIRMFSEPFSLYMEATVFLVNPYY